jgi:ribosomal protein L13
MRDYLSHLRQVSPLETDDIIKDGEVLAEDQLKLQALRIKNNHLQKQKEILAAKRQRIIMQAKVRQMIPDEEQKAKELEQQIVDMQGCNTQKFNYESLVKFYRKI